MFGHYKVRRATVIKKYGTKGEVLSVPLPRTATTPTWKYRLDQRSKEYKSYEGGFPTVDRIIISSDGQLDRVRARIERESAIRLFILDAKRQVYRVQLEFGAKIYNNLAITLDDFEFLTENYVDKSVLKSAEYDAFFAHYICVPDQYTPYCRCCLRYFLAVRPSAGVINLCGDCFASVLGRVADEREEQVQREFTGYIAGLVDEDKHAEVIQKARGTKRSHDTLPTIPVPEVSVLPIFKQSELDYDVTKKKDMWEFRVYDGADVCIKHKQRRRRAGK